MLATFEETLDPAKFRMKYWGVANYLQSGSELCDIYMNRNLLEFVGFCMNCIKINFWKRQLILH